MGEGFVGGRVASGERRVGVHRGEREKQRFRRGYFDFSFFFTAEAQRRRGFLNFYF